MYFYFIFNIFKYVNVSIGIRNFTFEPYQSGFFYVFQLQNRFSSWILYYNHCTTSTNDQIIITLIIYVCQAGENFLSLGKCSKEWQKFIFFLVICCCILSLEHNLNVITSSYYQTYSVWRCVCMTVWLCMKWTLMN